MRKVRIKNAKPISIKDQKTIAEFTVKVREYEEGTVTLDILRDGKNYASAIGIKTFPNMIVGIIKDIVKKKGYKFV